MVDKYRSFSELVSAEPVTAYSIKVRNRQSQVLVVAPHGGSIEPGTSEIALSIAADDWSYYLFEGIKATNNANLHITSTHFDDPACLNLLATTQVVITVHGESNNDEVVFVGGRHSSLASTIQDSLSASGFFVRQHQSPELQGMHPENICNRGIANAGVQLELSRGLRATLFKSLSREGRKHPTPRFHILIATLRHALRNF